MAQRKQSIVVTGGASGIGLAMTRYFAKQGTNISILDINTTTGPTITRDLGAEFPNSNFIFKKCDITSWDEQAVAFKQIYNEIGHIDIVMANAGVAELGRFIDLKKGDDELEENEPEKPNLKTLEIDLIGTIYTIKLAFHYLCKNTKGHIICTASNAGLYPLPAVPIYAASKHGLVGLVRSLARPLAQRNIQINALAPAVVETNLAPSKEVYDSLIVTPMSTVIRAVEMLIDSDTTISPQQKQQIQGGNNAEQQQEEESKFLTGQVVEVHGDKITFSQPQKYVDEDTRRNAEMFWTMGNAIY